MKHEPLENRANHPPDFRVSYRFYSEDEGGRKTYPHQGYRSDFWYEHPKHTVKGIFMIWPEFENEDGDIILEGDVPVPANGTARMWVARPEFRDYHTQRMSIGTKGYFMEGGRRVAECEIIEFVGIETNPRFKN